mmetsp:Transcript_32828/g.63341  ORF Transcript_32828/g.63341 Transcript_32828/m.63341 type:complete len:136 (+) Transcript_32828:291-698(+)
MGGWMDGLGLVTQAGYLHFFKTKFDATPILSINLKASVANTVTPAQEFEITETLSGVFTTSSRSHQFKLKAHGSKWMGVISPFLIQSGGANNTRPSPPAVDNGTTPAPQPQRGSARCLFFLFFLVYRVLFCRFFF